MQAPAFKNLGIAASIFFFASNLTSMFLPVYFITLGLSIYDIAIVLLTTFLIIGFLPIILLKTCQKF